MTTSVSPTIVRLGVRSVFGRRRGILLFLLPLVLVGLAVLVRVLVGDDLGAAADTLYGLGLVVIVPLVALLATTGVLVNAIAPAAVESPMNAGTDPAILARSQSLTPMARMGRADEIAELISWLSSSAVSYSTGAVYDASGGRATY